MVVQVDMVHLNVCIMDFSGFIVDFQWKLVDLVDGSNAWRNHNGHLATNSRSLMTSTKNSHG